MINGQLEMVNVWFMQIYIKIRKLLKILQKLFYQTSNQLNESFVIFLIYYFFQSAILLINQLFSYQLQLIINNMLFCRRVLKSFYSYSKPYKNSIIQNTSKFNHKTKSNLYTFANNLQQLSKTNPNNHTSLNQHNLAIQKITQDIHKQVNNLQQKQLHKIFIVLRKYHQGKYQNLINTLYQRILQLDHSRWTIQFIYHFLSYSQDLFKKFDEREYGKKMKVFDKMIKVIQDHFEKFTLNNFFSFLIFLQSTMDIKRKIALGKLAQLINRIENYTLKCLKSQQSLDIIQQKVLNSTHFYLVLLKLGYVNNHINTQLYQQITKKAIYFLFKAKQPFKTYCMFYNLIRSSQADLTQLENKMLQLYNQNLSIQYTVKAYDQFQLGRLVYSNLIKSISQNYRKLQIIKSDNHLYMLKQDLPKPQICQFSNIVLKLIKSQVGYLIYTQLKIFWPQIFTENIQQSQRVPFKKRSNDFQNFVQKKLKQLRLNYERQSNIKGRTVDYLVNNNIIVEVDGDLHYIMDKKSIQHNFNTKTIVRNYICLYLGYRILVFNLAQYNLMKNNNTLDNQNNLFTSKLNLMIQNPDIMHLL